MTRRGLLGAGLGLLAQGALADEAAGGVWPAWTVFRRQFLGDGARVVDRSGARALTTSEGQAYALFFSLVANDRAGFERILGWTEDNLCGGDLSARLPAWAWGQKDDQSWGVLDANAASDADLWLAYTLGEAARLWRLRPLRALSELLAARILREECAELPDLGLCLLPGPQGFVLARDRWRLNPSYLAPQLLQRLRATQPQPDWQALCDSARQIVLGSAPLGFVPDWTQYQAGQGFLADSNTKAQGSYNAIRSYLWVGMLHPQAPARQTLLAALAPMAHLVRQQGQPPEAVDAYSGQASGPGPSGFSAALLPFLQAQGDSNALRLQMARLEAKPIPADAYYAQALSLFAGGWMDGSYRFVADGQLQPRWSPA